MYRQIDMDELFDKVIEGGSKNYFRAESIEDLADQIQVPVETLKATIKRYNADCAVGYDSLFNKKRKFLRPVKEAKYYAIRRKNGSYGSVGGIRINEKAQVKAENNRIINGLYAAGDCANSMIARDTALMYSLWGSCLGFAANFGRIAGENAADYVTT